MSGTLRVYKTLPPWQAGSIPAGFKKPHNTQIGTWARLQIRQGWLQFAWCDKNGQMHSTHRFDAAAQPPLIEPQRWHRIVEAIGDLQCQLHFLCAPEDYFGKKYDLPRTHSEVLAAMPHLQIGKALDVGCGRGRNALYLALHGFAVEGIDNNPESLQVAREIKQQERLDNVSFRQVDLNRDQRISGTYDFVLSTVVLMFLQRASIAPLIAQMQQATRQGGHNLIVAAMDSADYPCREPFPFAFRAGELRDYYRGWQLLKYNEDVGHLHKTDAQGHRIALRFATLLARKT